MNTILYCITTGLCTKWWGWPGFSGSIIGQITLQVLIAYGVLP